MNIKNISFIFILIALFTSISPKIIKGSRINFNNNNVKRNDTIEQVFNNIENVTNSVTYEIIESELELDTDNVTYYNAYDINNVNESDVDKDWEQKKKGAILLGVIVGGIILLGIICGCLSWLCHAMNCPVFTRTVTTRRDTHNSVEEFDEYCCCIPEWDNDNYHRHRRESRENDCIIC